MITWTTSQYGQAVGTALKGLVRVEVCYEGGHYRYRFTGARVMALAGAFHSEEEAQAGAEAALKAMVGVR